ncbi:MAG: ABC transporter permease [Dehalococcoidia bacterium]
MTTLNIARAFFMRDLRVAWSYRFAFFFQNASLLFSVLTLRFVSDLLGKNSPAALEAYGGDYFSFVLLGAGLSLLAYPVTKSFASAVRAAQVTGTFEAMLTTRASGATIVVCSSLYSLTVACVQLALMWVIGGVVFGADLRLIQLPLVALVVAMTVAVLAGVGLLSAAFVIAFKQNEPFTSAFVAGSLLISGIMYPTSVLPHWMELLSPLLPLTHAAELTRFIFLNGADSSQAGLHLAALAGFCVLLPIGIFALNISLDFARRTGSLSQY